MSPPSTPGIYLDYNATAPQRPAVIAAVCECLADTGNPSSVHGPGRQARRRLETAREAVAGLVGTDPGTIVFTSGATEANNLALQGEGPILASAIEHPSILEARAVTLVPVNEDGVVDLEALDQLLDCHRPAVVTVMLANNETGVIQPVAEVAGRAHAKGARVHTDAVQGVGKLHPETLRRATAVVDSFSLSAHKFGGPPGVGALVVRGNPPPALLKGGAQEGRRRAGTENLPGIVGFGVAATLARDDPSAATRFGVLRDRMEALICAEVPETRILGGGANRLGNTSCLAMPGLPSETQLIAFDLEGIAVSSGAACSSGKVGPSHVVAAMGVAPEVARNALRVSLGWATTETDVIHFAQTWLTLHRQRAGGGGRGAARPVARKRLQSAS